jgi:hypothetical protein
MAALVPPYVFPIVAAAIVLGRCVTAVVKNRRDAQLRQEALAHPVQWSASVRVQVWARAFGLPWGSSNGPMRLNIRGGYLELAGTFPGSAALGFRWYFRSHDVRIQAVRRVGLLPLLRERIMLTGQSSGRDVKALIWSTRDTRAIWNALVDDGAIPEGPPPGGSTY